MASSSALIALLVVLGCAAAASAATFTVGDGQGWTTGANYATWASGKTLAVGDKLGESGLNTTTFTQFFKKKLLHNDFRC